ncbi:uncharacterized protein LOC128394667 [Panonychus citri]|uniref:uncharacterized protein LOC128394667 n=1 Tax=Panonychus citri TaxID=50023 RepID=UPI00230724C1|nr:uncharacterized protein LOC128394667 [Panonychus citri]
MYHSCVSLILYSFILGELIETIKGLPDKFNSQLKSADPYRPFSSVETATGTKLSPNGAAIRQWETRSWISTIPLQKATSVNDNNHHHDLETGLTPTTTSTSTSSSSDDQFDYGSTNDSSNCRGDNCRKSPFQGTYDTINYQKKMVYPDKQSTRIEEPTYSRGFRGDDDYGEEGGRQSEQPHHQNSYHRVHHHQRTHHNSNEPADRENEKNSRSNTGNPSNPHPLNWHHHAHPKGRSSRWESDMSSFDNNKDKDDHGSDHDDSDWNKKNWRERSNFGRDSGFNSKSFEVQWTMEMRTTKKITTSREIIIKPAVENTTTMMRAKTIIDRIKIIMNTIEENTRKNEIENGKVILTVKVQRTIKITIIIIITTILVMEIINRVKMNITREESKNHLESIMEVTIIHIISDHMTRMVLMVGEEEILVNRSVQRINQSRK